MNKFKFEPPQEHRRSLLPPKNQHITLTNTLDKCTQIVREDRLFIRNQIKNNNPMIFDIFKQYARPSQFQNLQIKLRKYVQNIKNHQKAQQLSKFKQSLQGNSSSSTTNLSKRPNQITKTSHSNIKQSFKQNSVQLMNKHNNSNFNYRDSRSQEPLQNSTKYLNHSLKHFQDLLKYKLNQDIIEERQSQNVTSARLVRPEYQHNKRAPLQEYDSNQHRGFNKTTSNHYAVKAEAIHEPINFNNLYKQKMKHEQHKAKALPWHFQNKPKSNIPFYNKAELQSSLANHSRNKTFQSFAREPIQEHYEQRQESIFDKHFDQSDKVSSQQEKYQNHHAINQFKNHVPSLLQSTKIEKPLEVNRSSDFYFQLKDNQNKGFKEMEKPRSKADISSSNSSRNDQNLFTPQDLLNQCRNFLKNRESTMKKIDIMTNPNDTLTNPLSEPLSSAFNEKQCLFNRNNNKEEEFSLIKAKEQQKSYIFPQIKEEDPKPSKQFFNLNHFTQQNIDYNNLQTFNNIYEDKPILSFPTFQIQQQVNQNKPVFYKNSPTYRLPEHFSIESFLQNLIEYNELNPFITVKNFKLFLDNVQTYKDILKHLLKSFIQQPNSKEIFLVSIAEKLNTIYNESHSDQYPHNDKQIHFIYELLDIDQKGFINREDIKLFLSQIQEAEVENYEQVEDQLWRLFEGADFTNEQRLSYWHFSFVKNSQQFEKVYHLLSQFQFQIQRNA